MELTPLDLDVLREMAHSTSKYGTLVSEVASTLRYYSPLDETLQSISKLFVANYLYYVDSETMKRTEAGDAAVLEKVPDE